MIIYPTCITLVLLIGSFQNVINGLPVSEKESTGIRKPYENPNLSEGDMKFPTPTSRGVAKRGSSVPWTNGIVPYEITTADFSLSQQAFIVATMQKMERIISMNNYKCIQFRPRNASDTYYITFINGNGCYSYIGQNTGLTMVREVSLQHPGCLYEGIVMHELLHTLGFFHEQSRPDRDSYVQVNYANIISGQAHNFDKYNNTIVDVMNTSYDYSSVMHYEQDAFSSNGLPTIVPLQAGVTIGQRGNMSAIDILEVRMFYNCSTTGQTLPTTPATTTINLYRYNSTIASTFTSTNQAFACPTGATFCYYDRYLIKVYIDGFYLIKSSSSLDTFGYLYRNSFNPASPSTNRIAYDDDTGGNSQFQFDNYLQSNMTYILVASTYFPNITGAYSVSVSGYDQANITKIYNTSSTTINPTTTLASSTTRTTTTSVTRTTTTSVTRTTTTSVTTTTVTTVTTTSAGISNFSKQMNLVLFLLIGLAHIFC